MVDDGQDILLAIAYRSHPVCIWSPLDMQMIGQCGPRGVNGVNGMVFNSNPEIPVLIISFTRGHLYVYNYTTMDLEQSVPGVYADCLACSGDGHTLVTGTAWGLLRVFHFDADHNQNITLKTIYQVKVTGDGVQSVAFNSDGLRFVDIVRRQCRVWEPAALLTKDMDPDSLSEALSQSSITEKSRIRITSPPDVSQDGRFIFAGREHGSVTVFSAVDGHEICEACTHGRET